MKTFIYSFIFLVVSTGGVLPSQSANAQSTYEELQAIVPARVEAILDERVQDIMGTDATTVMQTVSARILEGEHADEITWPK